MVSVITPTMMLANVNTRPYRIAASTLPSRIEVSYSGSPATSPAYAAPLAGEGVGDQRDTMPDESRGQTPHQRRREPGPHLQRRTMPSIRAR
jgi:hypothetical protein